MSSYRRVEFYFVNVDGAVSSVYSTVVPDAYAQREEPYELVLRKYKHQIRKQRVLELFIWESYIDNSGHDPVAWNIADKERIIIVRSLFTPPEGATHGKKTVQATKESPT